MNIQRVGGGGRRDGQRKGQRERGRLEYRGVNVPPQDYIINIDSLEVKACSDLMTASQSTGK